jgi:hypothetical protein
MSKSYKPEVQADSSGKWTSNALRFASETEAQIYAVDLAIRWTAVRDTRVVESGDPVTSAWINGVLVPLVPLKPGDVA